MWKNAENILKIFVVSSVSSKYMGLTSSWLPDCEKILSNKERMNILTFDIEEWYLEKVKGGEVEEKCRTFDNILSQILDMLDVK
jgi:hypothetical protein